MPQFLIPFSVSVAGLTNGMSLMELVTVEMRDWWQLGWMVVSSMAGVCL